MIKTDEVKNAANRKTFKLSVFQLRISIPSQKTLQQFYQFVALRGT